MSLEQKDIELIEQIVNKNGDDIAVSIARSFQRLEERLGDCEESMRSRLAETEERLESSRQDALDTAIRIKEDIRMLLRTQHASAFGHGFY